MSVYDEYAKILRGDAEKQKEAANLSTQAQLDQLAENKKLVDAEKQNAYRGAYVDYAKNINPYGVQSELAYGSGLGGAGKGETAQANFYNTYQNRLGEIDTNATKQLRDIARQEADVRLSGEQAKLNIDSQTNQQLAAAQREDGIRAEQYAREDALWDKQVAREDTIRAEEKALYDARLEKQYAREDALWDKQVAREDSVLDKQYAREDVLRAEQYAREDLDSSKNYLISLMSSTGYNPTDAELTAAGMTRSQANAFLQAYRSALSAGYSSSDSKPTYMGADTRASVEDFVAKAATEYDGLKKASDYLAVVVNKGNANFTQEDAKALLARYFPKGLEAGDGSWYLLDDGSYKKRAAELTQNGKTYMWDNQQKKYVLKTE